ncbi:Asparagine synthetase [Desulfosarcina cetonica]|uniref:asparagine synthase (glutamine-hydrolyzing) n=1 Tax=Desulfosarcina cetonica TaxID=90730 RepID=UPI0006CF4686|nr:asparagine synthase (glutamine-hydrolyzing) [Desulfosarcina cetonica]VTR68861.1 Asparagine synthetase [Desulfosarcina cetonica]
MCGIAGIVNFGSREEMVPVVGHMLDLMAHRGPDATGIYQRDSVALGHARLSIIDLSDSGHQPIHNEDKTVWITFNGEIFNYPELREDLVEKGHRFYTQTDTEVLVHLYEAYGTDMFALLNGQFAFAIWDVNRQSLLMARDRVGIRPFFYHRHGQRLVFASEIKALFADPSIPRALDPGTLSDIFTCWTTMDGATPFSGVAQLPPGHYARFDAQGLSTCPYWRLPFGTPVDVDKPVGQWVEDVRAVLLDATRIRLRADVPVGAYLSGGIDSTYTSTVVKRHFNNRLHTFSVGFTDPRFDEAAFQEIAVASLGTEHRAVRCSEADIGRIFPQVVWHAETPLLRTGPSPLFLLSRLVRESDFKVVLTGEGADEVFAGYNIFKEAKIRRFWAKHPESSLRPALLGRLYPYIFSDAKAGAFLKSFFKRNLTDVDSPAYSHYLRWHNTDQLKGFFSPDLKAQADTLDGFITRFTQRLPDDFTHWDMLTRAQYIESRLFLSNYLLSSQGDRMAMANSIEGRFPFLDHRVVELAAKIPSRLRMPGLTEKSILKKAARGLIPDALIDRAKQPYRAPISRCFFGETAPAYVADLLSEPKLKRFGYFDAQKVARLVAKCGQGNGALLSERENMAVVGILSTQLIHHQFIEDFHLPQDRKRAHREVM